MTRHAAAGLLLAGGASRRFGSDKAQVEVDGHTLAVRTAAAVGAAASPALEVGPGASGLDRVTEDDPGSGPLLLWPPGGGICRLSGSASTCWSSPVDTFGDLRRLGLAP